MARRKVLQGTIPMDRVREILRLWELGLKQRGIHRTTGIARSSIQEYLRVAAVTGLTYERACSLSDEALRELLQKRIPGRSRKDVADPDYSVVHFEFLSRKGVTLELLWKEWVEATGGGYSYSTFCRRYQEWCVSKQVVYRNEYAPGEKLISDYAGETLYYWDDGGVAHEVQIFVAVLAASNRTYAEATESQKVVHWVNSHIRALSYFGGVAEATVIDNLKSGVAKSHRYEPEIARAFEEFAAHYGTTVLPARAGQPRDKAKGEKAVQEVERQVLAPLRNTRFCSVAEINSAIRPLLEVLNNRPMRDYGGASRNELFERLDKPALKPLPVLPFVAATWKRVRVAKDYHIEADLHWYSVPYYHVRKEVWAKSTEKLVAIFLNNERIASHKRSFVPYRYTTVEAHMPPAHRAVRSWTADNFLHWAHGIGAATEKLVTTILNIPRHKEQAFRSIRGIQRLAERYGAAAVEKASALALERKLYSQRALHQILETMTASKEEEVVPPLVHSNIRGGNYYH